jgi:hypothetical protein
VDVDTFTNATSTWTTQSTGAPMNYPNGIAASVVTGSGTPVVIIPNLQSAYTYTINSDGGAWSTATPVSGIPVGGTTPFVSAALRAGVDEILAVFSVNDTGLTSSLQWAKYSGGAWTAGSVFATGVYTSMSYVGTPVSLAALPDGRVAVAYFQQAGTIQIGFFDGTSWGTPKTIPGVTASVAWGPLSIAPGVAGAVLEVAYVGSSGVEHVRLSNEASWTWTSPVVIGAGVQFVSISAP